MNDSVRAVASEAELLGALGPAEVDGRALILIGGADDTEPERLDAIRALLGVVAVYSERTGTAVVDGGTDSGVMRLIAEARAAVHGEFLLIGVAPTGAFERPTRAGTQIEPARDHSLIFRVPGAWFGDETSWLFAAADHLGGGSAATIVVNGGKLTFDEAHQRIAAGHPVIAVEGSGRAADELAGDEALRASGRLRVIPMSVDAAGLAGAIDADWLDQGSEEASA
ncbi:MAG: hypothetical protein ABIZ52_08285 [Candidatus Limnocylindrales bacterium]